MESVEAILPAQVLSATLEVYKDSLAPPPSTRRAWERAPRSASAPRLLGQKIWKRSGLRSHDNKENDEIAIQAELEKRGTGSRKKRRIQGAKENISEAKWSKEFTQSNDLEKPSGTKEGARLSMAFNEPERGLIVPRKRTNANHLVTPRKAMKKRPSYVSNETVQSPIKVLNQSPEKSVRGRASMRRSLRGLTVTPEDVDVDVQATATFTFQSPRGPTRDFVASARSPNVLQESIITPSNCRSQDASMPGQALYSTMTSDVGTEREIELEISEEEQIAEQLYATSPMKRYAPYLEEILVSADGQAPVGEDHVHPPIDNSEEQITPVPKVMGTPKTRRTSERFATRRSTRSTRSSLITINQDATLLIEQFPGTAAEAPLSSTPENRIKITVKEVMPTPQPNLAPMLNQTPFTRNEESDNITISDDLSSTFAPSSEITFSDDREMIWSGVPDAESEAHEDDEMAEDSDVGDSHLEKLEDFEDTMVFNRGGSEEFSNDEDHESETEQSVTSSICGQDSTQDPHDSSEPEDADAESPTINSFYGNIPTETPSSPSSNPDETIVDSLEYLEPIPVSLDGSSTSAGDEEDFDTAMEDAPLEVANAHEQRATNYDSDDTTVLLDFLSRHANKAAKAEVPVPDRKRSLPHSPLRLPMSELEEPTELSLEGETNDEFDVSVTSEEPSKRKRRNSRSQNDEDLTELPTSIRRSGRTRLPIKSSQPAPSSIPFRRLGSDSTVTLQQNKEKELAAITRFNTRKNKGNALYPLDVLATQTEKGDIPSRHRALKDLKELFDEKAQKQLKGKKAKSVVWAEQLTHYSTEKKIEDEKEADKEKGKTKEKSIIKKKVEIFKEVVLKEKGQVVSAAEEKTPLVEGAKPEEKKLEERKRSSIPRVNMRSKMGLGMPVNGTPAPKRRMKRS